MTEGNLGASNTPASPSSRRGGKLGVLEIGASESRL
jgi:hypothetical protein